MERDTVESIVRESVAPVNERFEKFIESEKESRRVLTALVTRLTTVVAGDKEFKQRGLVDTVEDHEKAIEAFTSKQTETRGAVRATMVIGGTVITLIQLVIQIYFARG